MTTPLVTHPGTHAVTSVTDANSFSQLLASHPNKLIVVDFFAQWCGPCKAIAPEVEKLATANPNVVFLKVDTDRVTALAAQYQIAAMPTFKFFWNSEEIDKFSGADLKKLKDRVAQLKTGPPIGQVRTTTGVVKEVTTMNQFSEFTVANPTKLIVVDWYAPWCGPCQRISPDVEKLAANNPDVVFLKVNTDQVRDLARHYQIGALPTFMFFRNMAGIAEFKGADLEKLTSEVARLK